MPSTQDDISLPSDSESDDDYFQNNKQNEDAEESKELSKEESNDVPIELQKRKKARTSKPFNEDDLKSQQGFEYIYKTFPNRARFHGPGHEARDLNNLIGLYSEWAFRLHPGLAFQDLISRTESLGSKGSLKGVLNDLRDKERNRYLELLSVRERSNVTVDSTTVQAQSQSRNNGPISAPICPHNSSTLASPNETLSSRRHSLGNLPNMQTAQQLENPAYTDHLHVETDNENYNDDFSLEGDNTWRQQSVPNSLLHNLTDFE